MSLAQKPQLLARVFLPLGRAQAAGESPTFLAARLMAAPKAVPAHTPVPHRAAPGDISIPGSHSVPVPLSETAPTPFKPVTMARGLWMPIPHSPPSLPVLAIPANRVQASSNLRGISP